MMINKEPDYEKAFNEFYGTSTEYDDTDTELDCLARADEPAAYDEIYEIAMGTK